MLVYTAGNFISSPFGAFSPEEANLFMYLVGERKELLDFYPICELVRLFLWMLAFVCAVCVLFVLKNKECFNYP